MAFALVLAFVPPDQLPVRDPILYVALFAGGAIIFTAAPVVLERFAKDSWLPPVDRAARRASGRMPPQERRTLFEEKARKHA